MTPLLFFLIAFFTPDMGVRAQPAPWPLLQTVGVGSSPTASVLAAVEMGTDNWRLVLEIILGVLVVVGFFKPQPPLHKQYADRDDTEKQLKGAWEVINGLRKAVQRIESSVAEIRTLREANGDRLDEVSRELLELIKQVSRLNERTSSHGESHHHQN
ncbi:MAG: hypothetical protein P4L99_21735 [Chthoniobacter sp.]|nr:hypothetical protein [Chthoniobacter sp.]